jgi:RNA polymerase sigma-70 factor (ECF subfamily)
VNRPTTPAAGPGSAEDELFRRARCGSHAAFAQLETRLGPFVRRLIRRLIGRSDAEEDIVREIFLSLFRNLGRIEPPGNLRPFLCRVLRNRCYDELRRQGRYRTLSLEADGTPGTCVEIDLVRDKGMPPDEALYWSLLVAQVRQAMELLPEAQRQALILYREENMTYPQIAVAMATDLGTIKSRIHHARKNLLRRLPPETLTALGLVKEEK